MKQDNPGSATLLDQAAVALSGLCLLHCLALPLLLAAIPVFGGLGGEHFHLQALVVVLPLSLSAFALGYRKHRRLAIVAWGVAGLLALIAGATLVHATYGTFADSVVTVTGALLLAGAHLANTRLGRRCPRHPAVETA